MKKFIINTTIDAVSNLMSLIVLVGVFVWVVS